MIYQFKVSLKGMSPPVWRRLQVDDGMTFYELHRVLQVVFDWEGCHLHSYYIRRRNAMRVNEVIEIENEDGGFPSFHEMREERDEILKDWFTHVKDRADYTYDFRVNWEHEIVLEKILMPEEGVRYPHCVKAVKLAPEEDSRGLEEEVLQHVEIEWRELTNNVNEGLADLTDLTLTFSSKRNGFDWQILIDKAKAFKALKPWKLLEDDQIFIVTDPVNKQFLYCSVLGAAEEEFGLAFYVGHEGLHALQATMAEEPTMDIVLKQRSLLLSFVDRDELVQKDYEFLKQYGESFRGRKQWIQFRSFVPGIYPWSIDEEEGRMMLLVIEQTKAMLEEVKIGLDIPSYMGGNEFLGRVAKEEDDHYLWQSCHIELVPKEKVEEENENEIVKLHLSEIELVSLKKMRDVDVSIVFDVFMVDIPVRDSKEQRPYFPIMAVALEEQDGLVVHQELVIGGDMDKKIQLVFFQSIKQLGGIPMLLSLKEEVVQALAPFLAQLPVRVKIVTSLPQVEEFRAFMSEANKGEGFDI
ncbi:plasmid pRiA4b ORF-3 family protein [Sporosarcina sp. E16_8]|uniref:plasmid pRiA4b ORF-3 family protein n=1 Tax=Sporosarcina sp. E16_8 TaxID=2789295 RepID=UPI001A9359E5|nr:plasmid pRiA4b ORF-3 family protein [Sporosarcina sp. E16_8]MBO0588347.1 plasmid pRiA4b ORF-3 family protein [Sporosarcina sp. E16_8]